MKRIASAAALVAGLAVTGIAPAAAAAAAPAAGPVPAAPAASADVDDFRFASLETDYWLTRDDDDRAALLVREEWVAEFPEIDQNRGIVRAIPDRDGITDLNLRIDDVTDENGEPIDWRYGDDESGVTVIELDDDTFKHGAHHYVIWYRMADVIRGFDDGDEFYPDVNGDYWEQPIGQITARLHVDPALTDALDGRTACFADDRDCTIDTTTQPADWPSDRGIMTPQGRETLVTVQTGETPPRSTLSFDVGFAPGTFVQPPEPAAVGVARWLLAAPLALTGIPVLVFLVMRGRDRRRMPQPIIAQYAPGPDVPLATAAVVAGAEERLLPAAVVDLAVRDVIAVEVDESARTSPRRGNPRMYTLTRSATPTGDDAKLVKALFGSKGTRFGLADTSAPRAKRLTAYTTAARTEAADAGYVETRRRPVSALAVISVLATIIALVVLLFFAILGYLGWLWFLAALAATVLLSVPLWVIRVRPARLTARGYELAAHLEGMREYIRMAEADRLRVLQGPETAEVRSDPTARLHLYERLLPYAVLFRLEKQWAAVLGELGASAPETVGLAHEGIYTALLTGSFTSSVTHTSTWAGAASGTSAGGSGFSGGGFSGGGFGGGGGGGR